MTSKPRWSQSEQQALAAHYPAISAKQLQEILPDRTAKAIITQASKLGVRKCHERLREMGAVNVSMRRDRQPPVQ